MSDDQHRELYQDVATLKERTTTQGKELSAIRNRVWAILVGIAVWAFNLISKKVGL